MGGSGFVPRSSGDDVSKCHIQERCLEINYSPSERRQKRYFWTFKETVTRPGHHRSTDRTTSQGFVSLLAVNKALRFNPFDS